MGLGRIFGAVKSLTEGVLMDAKPPVPSRPPAPDQRTVERVRMGRYGLDQFGTPARRIAPMASTVQFGHPTRVAAPGSATARRIGPGAQMPITEQFPTAPSPDFEALLAQFASPDLSALDALAAKLGEAQFIADQQRQGVPLDEAMQSGVIGTPHQQENSLRAFILQDDPFLRGVVQPAAARLGRRVGEDVGTYAPMAPGVGPLAALIPEDKRRAWGGKAGETAAAGLVPTKPWELTLELLPGIGTVPGVASFGRKAMRGMLDDAGLPATKAGVRALIQRKTPERVRAVLEAASSERGSLEIPGTPDLPEPLPGAEGAAGGMPAAAAGAPPPVELPPMTRLPETGQYAAIRTDDGAIYVDRNAPNRVHADLVRELGIPPERVMDGGYVKDGVYDPTVMSDAAKLGEQARAGQRVAEKRAGRVAAAPEPPQRALGEAGGAEPPSLPVPDTGRLATIEQQASDTLADRAIERALNPLRGKGVTTEDIAAAGQRVRLALREQGGVAGLDAPASVTAAGTDRTGAALASEGERLQERAIAGRLKAREAGGVAGATEIPAGRAGREGSAAAAQAAPVNEQLTRDAALYERAFGTTEPPPMPEALTPAAVEKYLPTRQGYIDQVTKAQEALDAAKARVPEVRAAYKAQAPRRRAVGAAKAKGMSETPEGMISKNEIAAAQKDVTAAREAKAEAKRTLDQADVLMTVDDILAEAEKAGADKATLAALRQTATDAAVFAQKGMQSDAGMPGWTARIRGTVAGIKGETPSAAVNAVSRAHLVLENAMRHVTDDWLRTWSKRVDKAIERERATLKYVGPAKRAQLAEENFAHAVIIHPEWYRGKSPELLAVLRETERFQRSKYAIVQALDPKAAAAVEDLGYLRTVWDIPESHLTTALPKAGGRVGVTKARGWPDPFDALASPAWPYKLKDMTAGELLESSARLSDRQIGIRMERKLILERYGRKGTQPKAAGYVKASNPNYAGWWLPKEVNNFIDQLHQPTGSVIRTASKPLTEMKNLVYGAGDVAVFGGHLLELATTRGPSAVAGAINRSLEAMHLPHFDVYMRSDMTRAMQRELAGLPQGTAGANVTLKGGTMLSWFGRYNPVGRLLDEKVATPIIDGLSKAQYQGVLTPARNMVYEGNLVMASALHKLTGLERFNPESAVVKRAAAENATAFSGASLGALKEGRRGLEHATLGSAQITRAMAAQIGQLGKLARPDTFEGMLAISTLATFAFTVYGMGSALNMTYGSGEPVEFDPRKPDWARVRLGGHWATIDGEQKYVGGQNIAMLPQASLIRTLAKSVAALQAGDSIKLIKAWEQLIYTRSTPGLQVPQNLAGFGFDPARGFRTGDLSPGQRVKQSAPIPPTLASAWLEGAGKTETALGGVGLQSYPGETAKEIHEGNQDDAREQRAAEFGRLETLAFTHDFWRKKLAPVGGDPTPYDTFADYRTAYIDRLTAAGVAHGMSPGAARERVVKHFDESAGVKAWHAAIGNAKVHYWKEHPDELARAYELGIEELNDAERRIYGAYKKQQTGAR